MKLLRTLLITTVLVTGSAAYAAGEHSSVHPTPAASHEAMGHGGSAHDEMAAKNTVKLSLEPVTPLQAGKTSQVVVKLNTVAYGKPISFDGLKEAHTKKLHLLVVDPSLTDYHHIHPVAGKNAGEFVFNFTP
jgi:hypothetical protein